MFSILKKLLGGESEEKNPLGANVIFVGEKETLVGKTFRTMKHYKLTPAYANELAIFHRILSCFIRRVPKKSSNDHDIEVRLSSSSNALELGEPEPNEIVPGLLYLTGILEIYADLASEEFPSRETDMMSTYTEDKIQIFARGAEILNNFIQKYGNLIEWTINPSDFKETTGCTEELGTAKETVSKIVVEFSILGTKQTHSPFYKQMRDHIYNVLAQAHKNKMIEREQNKALQAKLDSPLLNPVLRNEVKKVEEFLATHKFDKRCIDTYIIALEAENEASKALAKYLLKQHKSNVDIGYLVKLIPISDEDKLVTVAVTSHPVTDVSTTLAQLESDIAPLGKSKIPDPITLSVLHPPSAKM